MTILTCPDLICFWKRWDPYTIHVNASSQAKASNHDGFISHSWTRTYLALVSPHQRNNACCLLAMDSSPCHCLARRRMDMASGPVRWLADWVTSNFVSTHWLADILQNWPSEDLMLKGEKVLVQLALRIWFFSSSSRSSSSCLSPCSFQNPYRHVSSVFLFLRTLADLAPTSGLHFFFWETLVVYTL